MRVGDEFTSEVNAKYAQVICKFSVKYSYFFDNIKSRIINIPKKQTATLVKNASLFISWVGIFK